jgi:deoxycytidine triphosphate deaminase
MLVSWKDHGFNGDIPVVFQNSSNPVVILNGCEEEVSIGQQVTYEVTAEIPTCYLGDFKEAYHKENGTI